MRRTYTRERYLDRVAMIREHVPDCSLTTDIIVGFPGETEADFEQTLEVADEVGYDGAFTFIYSPRRGTEAAGLPDQVPHELKVERLERLVDVVQRRALERAQRFVGRTLEVLVEGPSRTDPSRLRGRSRHNKVVNFTGLGAPGELVEVRSRGRPARRYRSGNDPEPRRRLTFVQFRSLGEADIRPEAGIAAVPVFDRAETLIVGVIHGSVER